MWDTDFLLHIITISFQLYDYFVTRLKNTLKDKIKFQEMRTQGGHLA